MTGSTDIFGKGDVSSTTKAGFVKSGLNADGSYGDAPPPPPPPPPPQQTQSQVGKGQTMGLLDFGGGYANKLADMINRVNGGYGARPDGTMKGRGFFGEMGNGNNISTELSSETTLRNGNNLLYPLMSKGQNFKDMSNLLTGGRPSDQMYDQAVRDALSRQLTGRSPFADWHEAKPWIKDR